MAAEEARHWRWPLSARRETPLVREMRRLRRSSVSRRTARGLRQRQSDLAPVFEAAREAVSLAERALAALPDPGALEHDVENARGLAATFASAVADKRAEAATKARETAADRERLSAAAREQTDWRKRQADAEKRLAGAKERQAQQSAERSGLEKEPAELDRADRVVRACQRREPGQGRRGRFSGARGRNPWWSMRASPSARRTSDRPMRVSAAPLRRHARKAQQARSAELAHAAVEKFECVPQRLPETLGFDPEQLRDPEVEERYAGTADGRAREDRAGEPRRRTGAC